MSERIDRRWLELWGLALRLECWADQDTRRAYRGDIAIEDAVRTWDMARDAWNGVQRLIPRDRQDKRDAAYVHEIECDAARDQLLLASVETIGG